MRVLPHKAVLQGLCLTVMGCKTGSCKEGDCYELISYDCPLNLPGSLQGSARLYHTAADSQKHDPDFCLSTILTQKDPCSTRMSFSFCSLVLNATATSGAPTFFIHIQTQKEMSWEECLCDCVRH